MASVVILAGSPKVSLIGVEADDRLTLTDVLIENAGSKARLTFSTPVENVPTKLFEALGESVYKLQSLDSVAREGFQGALARLREELAGQVINLSAQGFFDFPQGRGLVEGGLSIRLPDFPDETHSFRLTAHAAMKFDAQFALVNYAQFTAGARLSAEVVVTDGDVSVALDMLVREFPNHGFRLRRLKMPDLSFSGLRGDDLGIGDLTALRLPVPDWLPEISITGGAPLDFSASKQDFIFTAGNAIQIAIAGKSLATIENFRIEKTGDTIAVTGTVAAHGEIAIGQTFDFGNAGWPVRGRVSIDKVEAAVAGGKWTLTWVIGRFSIEAADDPTTGLSVAFDLVTEINSADGATDFSVGNPRLLDFGANLAVNALMEVIDGLIDIRFGVLADAADALADFADRLARLLAAIVRHTAEAVGVVTGLLSELAKATASVLADGMRSLLGALQEAGDHVTVELRLDAATLRPVQLLVMPRKAVLQPLEVGGRLLGIETNGHLAPALVIDFAHSWQGLALLKKGTADATVTVATDLWLGSDKGESGSIPAADKTDRLIKLTAKVKIDAIVIAALQHGRGRFFQTFDGQRDATFVSFGPITDLRRVNDTDVSLDLDAAGLKNVVTALMPQGPAKAGGGTNTLTQFVKIDKFTITDQTPPKITGELILTVKLDTLEIPVKLAMTLDIETLQFKLDIEDEIGIKLKEPVFRGFGFKLIFSENATGDHLKLGIADGDIQLALADGASLRLSYDRLSSDGSQLMLNADTFGIGRGGLDLTASVDAEKPVRLGGLDQPFRFTSGSIVISKGALLGGTISGNGPMPTALIGEANAEIDLVFAASGGQLALVAANAKLQKEGEPLYSHGTRFRTVIDALGLGFKAPAVGPVQFYFQLWGSASFTPPLGEFARGFLKNIRSVAIRLDGAPLTGDGRELIKHISFLVELDPPLREKLFDIFTFEIRGIAFYPASDAWPDNPPAIGIAGQISFLEAGDVVSSEIDFHELLITIPEPGGDLPLPRIRADGLAMMLRISGVAKVEATAIAVDGTIPTLYAPVKPPADVTAEGFLASGRIDITGLGAFGGSMGVLDCARMASHAPNMRCSSMVRRKS